MFLEQNFFDQYHFYFHPSVEWEKFLIYHFLGLDRLNYLQSFIKNLRQINRLQDLTISTRVLLIVKAKKIICLRQIAQVILFFVLKIKDPSLTLCFSFLFFTPCS